MGQFDSNFNLPGISQIATTVSTQAQNAVSFAMSGVTTKIVEAGTSVMNTFGGTGNFDKLGANLPSFDSLASAAIQAGGQAVGSAIGDVVGGVNNLLGSVGLGGLVAGKINGIQAAATNGQASASQIKGAAGVSTVTSDHKVRLTDGTTTITFEVLPEIVEAHTIGYDPIAPAQFPGAFQKYKGTDSVTWTLNISLISRTRDEAHENYQRLNVLRGWKQPFFGQTTGNNYPKMLGAPPPVLTLRGLRDLIGPVPVVITSLNWTWPKDVDYLPTNEKGSDGNPIPFPAVMMIAVTMVESYSTKQFNQFDLRAYRAGKMHEAFNGQINTVPSGDEGE